MNPLLAIRTTRLALTTIIVATTSAYVLAQYESYPSTNGYSQPQQDYGRSNFSRPNNGPPPAQRYESTSQRYSTTDRPYSPAPVASSPGRQQQYNPSYTSNASDRPQERQSYQTSVSPGPYDNYRQRDEYRPDFRPRPEPAQPRPELFSPAQKVAIVVDETILAGDLLGDINQMLAPYEGQATKEQLDEQRQLLMQRMLPQMIQTKMLYQEMLASVPPEAVPQIREKLNNEFDEKQLPTLMERAKVDTPAQLDAKLRKFGSSIEKQRRQFGEQVLAREFVRQNVKSEPDVSHQEMLRYYQENISEYDRPARVRWEELAVRFDKFNNKSETYRAIANMGNRVLRGAAFSRVAREQSQGFTADNGGWYDWTQRETLKFPEIEAAIFDLPVDQLSRVIETDLGFHIVRVLDREEEGRTPFFQEQSRIKSKLQKQKRDAEVEAFLSKIKARTRVWTIFDDNPIAEPTVATDP